VKIGPQPIPLLHMGLRPSNQPAGRRSGPRAAPAWAETGPCNTSSLEPSIGCDQHRTVVRAPRANKTRRPSASLQTLTSFLFSPHHLARTEAAAGSLARGRRWPATVKGGAARHTAAACSSLPSILCSFLFFVSVPSSGGGGAVNPVAGRDRRR
jgi:hypothetical protein